MAVQTGFRGMARQRRFYIGLATLCVVLALAACDLSGSGGSSPKGTGASSAVATATTGVSVPTTAATPVVPSFRSLSLGNFQADTIFPSAHGFMLVGTPGSIDQSNGPAGWRAVYYYSNATQAITQVVNPTPAADGTARGVNGGMAAGDWITYLIADAGGGHWETWALDLVTGRHYQVDSAEQSGVPGWLGSDDLLTDGTQVVWSLNQVTSQSTSHGALSLLDLNTGQRSQVLTVENDFVTPVALFGGYLLYIEWNQSGQSAPENGTWLLKLGQTTPSQISTEIAGNASMNSHYIVWDQVKTETLTLYDRSTGQQQSQWGPVGCLRPAIAETQPYVVCLQYNDQAFELAQVPGGQSNEFFQNNASTGARGNVVNGRFYWLATQHLQTSSNTVDYIDLPTS